MNPHPDERRIMVDLDEELREKLNLLAHEKGLTIEEAMRLLVLSLNHRGKTHE